MNPGYVVIGDSMAGTRINERLLTELTGQPVAPLLQAGTGPVFWYLALKNWVIASGVKPRAVFIFFRDTNLTDTMFRLDEQFRWSLDMVAAEREDELNGVVASVLEGPFYAVHDAVERVYAGDRARRAIEPALTRAPATWITSSRRRQVELLAHANERFGLEHRDYVYIPLGGSQAGELKWARNVLVTFLLSGLWHGASWNYVLWGGYHGVLLILTRAHRILEPAKSPEGAGASGSAIRRLVVPLQIAGMFVLTLFGWLLFRQTELAAIARDLQLSPFAASPEDQRTGLYLFLLAFVYSIPLWIHSVWVEWHRDPAGGRQHAPVLPGGWPRMALQGLACGAAFAAILILRSKASLDFIYFQF